LNLIADPISGAVPVNVTVRFKYNVDDPVFEYKCVNDNGAKCVIFDGIFTTVS